MATLKAKRAGHCADCGRSFVEGTTIRWFPKIGTLCADKGACIAERERRAADALLEYLRLRAEREALPRYHTCSAGDRTGCQRCAANDAMCAVYDPESAATFTVPASVQARADDLAAGIEAARAMLAAVLS